MKTEKSTFRILFYIKRTKTLNNGELTIFMRITVDGERVLDEKDLWNYSWNTIKDAESWVEKISLLLPLPGLKRL